MEQLEQDYKDALIALRPRGLIWNVREGSSQDQELEIEAKMLTKIHKKSENLVIEANLLTTKDLLEEWEDVFELSHEGSYEERIAALNASANEGQLSKAQYITLCSVLGVTIEINEHYPFRFGISAFGGRAECAPPKMVFWWDIVISKAESDAAIEKMKSFIAKYKQSHTKVRFIDERNK